MDTLPEKTEEEVFHKKSLKQRLIDATHSKYGLAVLGFVAFIESAFFPIPPDFLLVPMVVAKPRSWKKIALIVGIPSILGSYLGYLIGFALFASVGQPIVEHLGLIEEMDSLGDAFHDNALVTLLLAAFTPLPYKLFTIAAGVFRVDLLIFTIASVFGRGLRYLVVPYLASIGGSKAFWDYLKNLKLITWIGMAVIIATAIITHVFFG